jgi:TfoX/Sxy family transcriptional regulator of competence genes
MATAQRTIDFILEQIGDAGIVSARKMFGEYGIYCDGKMVALVCNNQLFVKQTPSGKIFLGDCPQQPPYKGAKPCFLIAGEKWDDGGWLSGLIKLSAAELETPKKKRTKKG